MGRKVDLDDLAGAAELARLLGVHTQTVHLWRRRHPDFPEPVLQLQQAMLWLWPDVESWARRTGRL